jgi:hypothetical protein
VSTAQAALVVSLLVGLVGLYGALNSRRAIRWQRQRDIERRKIRARIEIQQAIRINPSRVPPRLQSGDLQIEHLVVVAAVNDSEEAVIFVRDLGVYADAPKHRGWDLLDNGDARLEPRQRLVREVVLDDEGLADFAKGFTATARLTSGDVIEERDRYDTDLIELPRQAHEKLRAQRQRDDSTPA